MKLSTEYIEIENGTEIGTPIGAIHRSRWDHGHKISLWLVDDQAEFRELVAEMFGQEPGFECLRRFASAEAMLSALARESAPDMILTDYSMKGMTGAEAVPLIKAMSPLTKAVVMTTFNDSEKRAAAMAAGADGFILKPHDWIANVKYLKDVAAQPARMAPVAVTPAGKPVVKRPAVRSRGSSMPPLARAMDLFKSCWRALVGNSMPARMKPPC